MIQKIKNAVTGFFLFLLSIWQNKYLILKLAQRDFKNRYLGSYLGLPWAFIQPLVTILVMWFVISFGLKAGNVAEGVPFGLWLVAGLIPWFFISEAILSSTGSLMEYAFLMKNIVFRPSIIPLIKVITALVIHSFFIVLIMIFAVAYGFKPSLHWIQLIYYLFCAIVLVTGINWLTSSFMVFIRDTSQAVGVIMQLLFWATPIIWTYAIVPPRFLPIFKLNPFFYIVEGYRETFIYHTWFFEHYNQTAYFWVVTTFLFVVGAISFKKLKPHFMDVL
jgi:ABC-type polysaccharide/polyol phosphate export permease